MDDREYIMRLIAEAEAEEINLLTEYLKAKDTKNRIELTLFDKSFD